MPTKIPKLLIDADYLVALFYPEDSGYEWAMKIASEIEKQDSQVFLSSPAFGEAITVVSQKAGKKTAVFAADKILSSPIQIIETTPSLRKSALKWFSKTKSKNTRFTDCVNMAILETWKSKVVVSRDQHYRQSGFLRLGIDK